MDCNPANFEVSCWSRESAVYLILWVRRRRGRTLANEGARGRHCQNRERSPSETLSEGILSCVVVHTFLVTSHGPQLFPMVLKNALIVRPPGQVSDVKAAGYSQFSQETVKFLLLNRVVRGGLASNHGRGSHKVFGKRSTDLPRS